MKNAEEMRAITLKAQEQKKRDKFNNLIACIEKTAEQGYSNYSTFFKRDDFTIKDLQSFSDDLAANGYDVEFGPSDNIKYIMNIDW